MGRRSWPGIGPLGRPSRAQQSPREYLAIDQSARVDLFFDPAAFGAAGG
jgi:hypothetical protein